LVADAFLIGYPSRTISEMLGIPPDVNLKLHRLWRREPRSDEGWDALGASELSGENLAPENLQYYCRAFAEVERQKVMPVFKMVDTCAGEFESQTPYYYGTFEQEDDAVPLR
jgi:hypothetical protein